MTAQELLQHGDTGEPWPAHGGDSFEDLASAYRVALAARALRVARGEMPLGFKVGFTNRTIWSRYAVFAPIWGSVWNTTVAFAQGNDVVPLQHLCQPRIEPEAVFGLKVGPRADAGVDDLFEALDWVAPGFELVQSHLAGWKFTAPQTVADGGLHGRLLVGTKVPVSALARDAAGLHALLAGLRVELHRNDRLVEEGQGANVLDSPLHALLHFVTELRSCPGAPELKAGDLVTTGTWTDAWPIAPGERWTARFSAALPSLEAAFS
jgi:2-keto-4-pentenoate hydratase